MEYNFNQPNEGLQLQPIEERIQNVMNEVAAGQNNIVNSISQIGQQQQHFEQKMEQQQQHLQQFVEQKLNPSNNQHLIQPLQNSHHQQPPFPFHRIAEYDEKKYNCREWLDIAEIEFSVHMEQYHYLVRDPLKISGFVSRVKTVEISKWFNENKPTLVNLTWEAFKQTLINKMLPAGQAERSFRAIRNSKSQKGKMSVADYTKWFKKHLANIPSNCMGTWGLCEAYLDGLPDVVRGEINLMTFHTPLSHSLGGTVENLSTLAINASNKQEGDRLNVPTNNNISSYIDNITPTSSNSSTTSTAVTVPMDLSRIQLEQKEFTSELPLNDNQPEQINRISNNNNNNYNNNNNNNSNNNSNYNNGNNNSWRDRNNNNNSTQTQSNNNNNNNFNKNSNSNSNQRSNNNSFSSRTKYRQFGGQFSFNGFCRTCGKRGHMARDCYSKNY